MTELDIYRSGYMRRIKCPPILVMSRNENESNLVWMNKEKAKNGAFITEKLCYEKVLKIAIKAFGKERVSVFQGAVRVRLNDENQMQFYTL